MANVEKKLFTEFVNKNILIIKRLSIFNFIFLIFLRILYDKIFFLEIDRNLRSKKTLLVLQILEINWLNYNQYYLQDVMAKKEQKSALYCDKYSTYISKKIWINSLNFFFLNRYLLAACINAKIYKEVTSVYEIMEMAVILQKKNKVSLFLSNNFFFKSINEKYFFKNLNFINFDIFKISNIILSVLFNTFLSISKKIILILFSNKKKFLKNKTKLEEKKFKVAFFPHKGIYNQNKIKDHFYLNKTNSNFNKKNIAHVEWSHSDLTKQSKDYYTKNRIPLFFWDNYSFKKKSTITIIKFFIFKFKLIYKLLEFSIFIEILTSAYQIINAKEKIKNNFNQLKYVLIGYDLLFSNEITIACKQLNIKTISVQDRILVPSWSYAMCFDYYFTLGPSSKKILKKRMGKTINFFYPTEMLKKNNDSLIQKKNKNKLKCLVIDYNSLEEREWYQNGRTFVNWKVNFNFYYSIFSLSKKYPNISFLIKSKNYIWFKSNYFKNLVKILNKQKNIKILNNQKKWTPEYSIKSSDFAIAKYSSLSDQMFYLNKPILILNYDGYPGLLYDFGNKILVNNSNQLLNKISLIEKNYHNYNKSLQQLRKELFFSNIEGNKIKDLLTNFDQELKKQ
jgi:hypothetical protein